MYFKGCARAHPPLAAVLHLFPQQQKNPDKLVGLFTYFSRVVNFIARRKQLGSTVGAIDYVRGSGNCLLTSIPL